MASTLHDQRREYKPTLPTLLKDLSSITLSESGSATMAIADQEEIAKLFPQTYGRKILQVQSGKGESKLLKIGVVFSGGQAAGGHNVITGLFDALQQINSQSVLIGFLNGPSGIVDGKYEELTADRLKEYRNQGGFDLLGSGRTKIETEEQLASSLQVAQKLNLDGLVIIGGDDSNTNAAVLAEYFLKNQCTTKVVGIPKTIDGDLKNEHIATSFGYDTACKVYAEMIGNIGRDALSAKKYYHFIKLMGRSASHIALECALQTQPNLTLIGEEVAEKKMTLAQITGQIADVICKRAEQKKDYGIVLIPEGLIEFIPEMRQLIDELNGLAAQKELSTDQVKKELSKEALNCFESLPEGIQEQLLLDRDPHGNVRVSQIETERLFIEMVANELKKRSSYKGKFSALNHFFGYEGRSGYPSNFDCNYCYVLGMIAALVIREGKTGYICAVDNLDKSPTEWIPSALPITMLMNIEIRKNKRKAVIQKALVDLNSALFKTFASQRNKWQTADEYRLPGPIQFFGPAELIDQGPMSLRII